MNGLHCAGAFGTLGWERRAFVGVVDFYVYFYNRQLSEDQGNEYINFPFCLEL